MKHQKIDVYFFYKTKARARTENEIKKEYTNLSFNIKHIEGRKEIISSLMQFYKSEFQSHF